MCQALQQAAAASGHLPPGDIPAALHGAQVDASGHLAGHMHSHMEHPLAAASQVLEPDQSFLHIEPVLRCS